MVARKWHTTGRGVAKHTAAAIFMLVHNSQSNQAAAAVAQQQKRKFAELANTFPPTLPISQPTHPPSLPGNQGKIE